MANKIQLSPKKILNKQFQIDFKGYSATEVDYFLDSIVEDYETFASMLMTLTIKLKIFKKKMKH